MTLRMILSDKEEISVNQDPLDNVSMWSLFAPPESPEFSTPRTKRHFQSPQSRLSANSPNYFKKKNPKISCKVVREMQH